MGRGSGDEEKPNDGSKLAPDDAREKEDTRPKSEFTYDSVIE